MPLPIYQLYQSDIPDLNSLLQNVHNWRKVTGIDIAIQRYNSAYRGDPVARLIDHMIAFEALYLGDIQELQYKLAIRSACLLAKDKKTRKRIFNDIKRAYKIRSQILHGNTLPNKENLEEIIAKTEEYLRQSICRFLLLISQGYAFRKIRESLLDENILTHRRLI
jgi:hypothetical protein